jgi:DNA-binding LacI/PurR family transcriptional regulator
MLTDTIALLSRTRPATSPGSRNQISTALQAVSRQVESSGHHTLLIHPDRLEGRGIDSLLGTGVKGLLVIDEVDIAPSIQNGLEACRGDLPVVVRGYGPESQRYDRVISDHEGGCRALTRRLIDRGCRRILRFWRVTGKPPWLGLRNAGYERAMREAGLEPIPPLYMPEVPVEGISERSLHDRARLYAGYLVEHLKGPEPIDAIMVVTDAHAFQAAASLRLLDVAPNEDVLIAGFDNLAPHEPWAQWEPTGPLLTVDKNNDEGGRMMVELLDERASDLLPPDPVCRVAPHELIELQTRNG